MGPQSISHQHLHNKLALPSFQGTLTFRAGGWATASEEKKITFFDIFPIYVNLEHRKLSIALFTSASKIKVI